LKTKTIYFFCAICWFIITTVLLCIPGNNLPKIGWLHILQFDKFVHIFIFGILSFLFCKAANKKWFLLIALFCSIYGMAMEFVQENWIPNRSFDVWDIVADSIGSFGVIFFFKFFNKKAN
jgi:VanZ family protein